MVHHTGRAPLLLVHRGPDLSCGTQPPRHRQRGWDHRLLFPTDLLPGQSPSLLGATSPLPYPRVQPTALHCLLGFKTVKRAVSSRSQGRCSEEAGWMD